MNGIMRTALAAVTALVCTQATAQTRPARTASDQAFERLVARYGGNGTALIYECAGADGEIDRMNHHPERLVEIADEMAAGDAASVARRRGCRRSNDNGPTEAFHGIKLFSRVSRDDDALWLVGEVVESYPQATGYTFEAIVRIPLVKRMLAGMTPARNDASSAAASKPAPASDAAAKADALFYEMRNTRTVRDTEASGYLTCPSDAAIGAALDAAAGFSPKARDTRTAGLLKRAGCVEGKGAVTGVRVGRMLTGESVTWHAASGVANGRRAPVVFWMF